MLDSVFRHEFKQRHGVQLTENHILFRKPLELYNLKTDESIKFNSLDDAYKFEIDGKTIKQIITDATMEMFKIRLDGGSGNGSGSKQKFKFGNGGANNTKLRSDLPARMNTKIKTKTVAGAISEFRNKHQQDKKESMIMIDSDGFVSQYNHGAAHSLAFTDTHKNGLVVHNHPSDSHFSKRDLLNLSTTQTRGVVATTKQGYYHIEKGTHFKANKWANAVNNAVFGGKDYNDAVDKWLKRNQKTYGYKYKNVKDAKTKAPKIKFDASGQGSFF